MTSSYRCFQRYQGRSFVRNIAQIVQEEVDSISPTDILICRAANRSGSFHETMEHIAAESGDALAGIPFVYHAGQSKIRSQNTSVRVARSTVSYAGMRMLLRALPLAPYLLAPYLLAPCTGTTSSNITSADNTVCIETKGPLKGPERINAKLVPGGDYFSLEREDSPTCCFVSFPSFSFFLSFTPLPLSMSRNLLPFFSGYSFYKIW